MLLWGLKRIEGRRSHGVVRSPWCGQDGAYPAAGRAGAAGFGTHLRVRGRGSPIKRRSVKFRRLIGLVPQENTFESELTIEQSMLCTAKLYGIADARNDKSGEFLTGRARHKTSLQLMYKDKAHGWEATLGNDWLDGYRYTLSGKTGMTGASIMNVVVNKKLGKQASAYFGINNLTNRENDILYYDGRIWRGGVKVTF